MGNSPMPYVYKVGYGSYEDSYYVFFSHPKKMSQRMLDKIVDEVLFEICVELFGVVKNDPTNFESYNWNLDTLTFAELYGGPFNAKMVERGFSVLDPQETSSMSGWSHPFSKNNSFVCKRAKKLRSKLKKACPDIKEVIGIQTKFIDEGEWSSQINPS